MTTPSSKSPAITKFLDNISAQIYGKSRSSSIAAGECVMGKLPGTHSMDFKDELSKREYTISGMCQTCQDAIFGK